MLETHDIEMVKETRGEIVQNRLVEITVSQVVAGAEDPFTGSSTSTDELIPAYGTWTAMTGSGSLGADYKYIDGVEVVEGDIIANFDIAYGFGDVKSLYKEGVKYVVRAVEKLGLGNDNRYFILARRAI